jgi:O-antigen/teichoic acid export membrane protein
MIDKFKQLGKESLIYGVAGMLNKFIAVFLVPLYTHVFSQEEYGLQGLVLATVTLASTLAVMGMDSAVHNWYWQTEQQEDRQTTIASWFWLQMFTAVLLGLGIYLAADPLSLLIAGDTAAAPLLRLGALTLPLVVSHGVVTNYFRLRRQAKATMWYSVVSNLVLVLLTMLFILGLKMGLPGFFYAQIAAGVGTTLAGALLLRGTVAPSRVRWSRLREMFPYALPLVPAAFAFWALGFSDRLFIEKLVSTGQVAVYQFAAALASAMAMVTGAFTTAWGPFALSLQRQPDAPQIYAKVLPAYLAGGGLVVAGLAFFGPEAVAILAPPAYAAAAPLAAWLSLGVLINGLAYIAGTGLALARRSSAFPVAVFLAAGASLALNALLIPAFGITGAAWAAVISWFVYSAFIFWRAQRIHPLPYSFRRAALLGVLLISVVLAGPLIVIESPLLSVLLKSCLTAAFAASLLTIALPGWRKTLRRQFSLTV